MIYRRGLLLGFASLAMLQACITVEKNMVSTQGQVIPGRRLFGLSTEYLCEPLARREIKEIEILLNEYGRNGWKLSSFLNKDGEVYGFCVAR